MTVAVPDGTSINIRAIQHYMYCPRRFALLEINNDWVENAFVVKANLLHENVHSGSHGFKKKSAISLSSVALYNDLPQYDLYGITDCVEFVKSENGSFISGLKQSYLVKIIEYKPKKPKESDYNETDAIQVFAQKICADYVFSCDSECYIYYADVKRRIRIPFEICGEEYRVKLEGFLEEMRKILEEGTIPVKRKGQKCSGCSLEDVCFPKTNDFNVKKNVLSILKEEKCGG